METHDVVIIGAGVIGLCLSLELAERQPSLSVCVIEKEAMPGKHASGRNSGVLHAGFYYSANSLKARFCKEGNAWWRDYCRKHQLPLRECGKLVVTQGEKDLPGLDELLRRAKKNGVTLHEVDEKQAKELEPRAITHQRAAFAPDTAVVDPAATMAHLLETARKKGIQFKFDCAYQGVHGKDAIQTSQGPLGYGLLINAAGLYADRVAVDFGFCQHYKILPFKGLYLYSSEPPEPHLRHIYPVPDLANPFLGVHHTLTVDGRTKIGPTAIPAFWREHYEGFSRFSPSEFLDIVKDEISLLFKADFNFRGLAIEELKKYRRAYLVRLSSKLMRGVKLDNYKKWGRPGIRAQLFDVRKKALVMDFLTEGDSRTFHILNAVSPGFTCAMPFSRHICDQLSLTPSQSGTGA